MMSVGKIRTVSAYTALGAFLAYLGIWWTGAGKHSYLVPVVSALAVNASGLLIIMARSGRWFTRSGGASERGHSFIARLEESLTSVRSPSRPHSPPAPAETDRNGSTALLGHEMKNYL